jgi:hypothetical protein
MLKGCCEDADDEISLASASLLTTTIIAFTSLLFGVILGMGAMFTSGMDTTDSDKLGFALILTGLIGFLITVGITIVRNERKRARVLVARQNSMF